MSSGSARTRVRLRYSKLGKVRFTSHRDTARIFERALRRAALPVAYTEGYAPRPKVSFGLALSTGHESLGEYLDVDLDAQPGDIDVESLPARLDPTLPVGFTVQGAAVVEPGSPSLQEAVVACTWRLEVEGAGPDAVGAAVERVLDAGQLVVTRERKGRSDRRESGDPGESAEDLRPALLDLALVGPTPSGTELEAVLATQPRALRPGEVVAAVAADLPGAGLGRVCRTHQWIGADGERREPLPRPAGLDGWSLAASAVAAPRQHPQPEVLAR